MVGRTNLSTLWVQLTIIYFIFLSWRKKCRKVSEKRRRSTNVTPRNCSFTYSLVGAFVGSYVFTYMRETNRFRSMFLAHSYLFSRERTHTSFVIVEIRIVFIQFADTHFTICCMHKMAKDKEENKRKQPGTKYTRITRVSRRRREKCWCFGVLVQLCGW